MPRLRRLCALVAATTGCLTVGAFASAGLAAPLDTSTTTSTTAAGSTSTTAASSTTTTPSTTAPASSSTTSTTRPPPLGGITQVTQPPSTTTTSQPGSTSSTVAGGDDTTSTTLGEGDNGAAVPRGVIPPDAQAMIDSYPRSPANSTAKLIAALQPLIDKGMPAEQAFVLGFGQFPVAGPANFV